VKSTAVAVLIGSVADGCPARIAKPWRPVTRIVMDLPNTRGIGKAKKEKSRLRLGIMTYLCVEGESDGYAGAGNSKLIVIEKYGVEVFSVQQTSRVGRPARWKSWD